MLELRFPGFLHGIIGRSCRWALGGPNDIMTLRLSLTAYVCLAPRNDSCKPYPVSHGTGWFLCQARPAFAFPRGTHVSPEVDAAYARNVRKGWRMAEAAFIASLLSMTNLVMHVKDEVNGADTPHTHTHIHAYVRTYTHTFIHTYIHTHIYIYIHI